MIGLINKTHQIETQEQQLKLQFPNHTFNHQLTSPIKADDYGQKQQQQVKKRARKVKQGSEDQSTTPFTDVKIEQQNFTVNNNSNSLPQKFKHQPAGEKQIFNNDYQQEKIKIKLMILLTLY
jgi:hypothetical protein